MSTAIKPLNDRILVKRVMQETTSPSGLIAIPDNRQVKSRWGEILAVGPGRYKVDSTERIPIDESLKPGAVIRFRGTSGQEIDIDGESGFVMLREDEVEALLVEGPVPGA